MGLSREEEAEPPRASAAPGQPTPADFARVGGPREIEALLERLDQTPAAEHAALYDELHTALRRRLDAEPPFPGAGA